MERNQKAYNTWAEQYDDNENRTRDLEALALRKILSTISFNQVLEIGCGTGKNSAWLVTKADHILGVDFSKEMLEKAKGKISGTQIEFQLADIRKDWDFTKKSFDLISFSLVLEHIRDLDFIFQQVKQKIKSGGYVYVGELHPFKQYQGSLARFETEKGRVELECFTHNISEFVNTARKHGLKLIRLDEWFDEDELTKVPRILTILFQAE